jgi:hypothetical protein
MKSLPNWADEVIELFATRVAAKINLPAKDYTSVSLPEGVNKRTFARRCSVISEARKEGRHWRCPVAAWHASFSKEVAGEDAYAAAVQKAGAR